MAAAASINMYARIEAWKSIAVNRDNAADRIPKRARWNDFIQIIRRDIGERIAIRRYPNDIARSAYAYIRHEANGFERTYDSRYRNNKTADRLERRRLHSTGLRCESIADRYR